jgi:hypothetical protein
MTTRLVLAATLSLAVSACAPAATTTSTSGGMAPSSAPASAASVNPVGRFEFTTSVQGQPITGGMLVAGSPGAYTGQITTSVTPPLPISSVTATGQEMVVTGSTPDGVITIRVNFTDATAFTGSWELSGDSGSLTGRRVM